MQLGGRGEKLGWDGREEMRGEKLGWDGREEMMLCVREMMIICVHSFIA
jgi:hypothetical protein